MKKIFLFLFVFLFLATADYVSAHAPRLIYQNQANVKISEPEKSQAFYDELKEAPKNYFVSSEKDFNLYVNLSFPTTTAYICGEKESGVCHDAAITSSLMDLLPMTSASAFEVIRTTCLG